MIEQCGFGKFSQVFKGFHKPSHHDVAIKIIDKDKLDELESTFLNTELAIVKILEHPHIVELIDVYEDAHKICIVTEFVQGGELFHYLEKKRFLPEDEAALIIYQMLYTLKYIHECGIVHRDLKPENILVEIVDEKVKNIRITDFGLSKMMTPEELCFEMCGTLSYVAPEILM